MKVKILHIPSGHITESTFDSIFAKQALLYLYMPNMLEYDIPMSYRKEVKEIACLAVGDISQTHWSFATETVRHQHLRIEFEMVYL
jgi:hypothetical protein